MKIRFWTEPTIDGMLDGSRGRLELNDQPIDSVTDFHLDASVGNVVSAAVGILASKNLYIEVDADTEIQIVALPKYSIFYETIAPGRVRYWTEPKEEVTIE